MQRWRRQNAYADNMTAMVVFMGTAPNKSSDIRCTSCFKDIPKRLKLETSIDVFPCSQEESLSQEIPSTSQPRLRYVRSLVLRPPRLSSSLLFCCLSLDKLLECSPSFEGQSSSPVLSPTRKRSLLMPRTSSRSFESEPLSDIAAF